MLYNDFDYMLVGFTVWPTEGPTVVPPVGPRPILATDVPPVEPNIEPKQSTVRGTVWPTDANAVDTGTRPPPVYVDTTTGMPNSLGTSVPGTGRDTVREPPTAAVNDVWRAPIDG